MKKGIKPLSEIEKLLLEGRPLTVDEDASSPIGISNVELHKQAAAELLEVEKKSLPQFSTDHPGRDLLNVLAIMGLEKIRQLARGEGSESGGNKENQKH